MTSLREQGSYAKQQASADFYGKYFWKEYQIREDTFLEFLISEIGKERLESARTLLDIGAGSGRFSIFLKLRFPHLQVTSVDLSPDNVATIQANSEESGVDLTTQTASALDLPFPDDHFDLVICLYMLQHTEDPEQGFEESARVLKPGGSAFYSIGRNNRLGSMHRRSRWLFTRVPTFLRKPFVAPAFPLYWGLIHLLNPQKASRGELMKDLIDWVYNPLQHFVDEREMRSWFDRNGLTFEHRGYTGLFKSMCLCRGTKGQGGQA